MPWPSKPRAIVSRDADFRACLDGDVHRGPDGPVHAADAPLVRRIEADDLRGAGRSAEPDLPRREAAVPDLGSAAALHMTADHALLPFREATRVGGIGEHLLGRAVDLDADSNRRHSAIPGDEVRVAGQVERPPAHYRRRRAATPSPVRGDRGGGVRARGVSVRGVSATNRTSTSLALLSSASSCHWGLISQLKTTRSGGS